MVVQHHGGKEAQKSRPSRGGPHESKTADPQVTMAQRPFQDAGVLGRQQSAKVRGYPLPAKSNPQDGQYGEQASEEVQGGSPIVSQRAQNKGGRGQSASNHQSEHGVGDTVDQNDLPLGKPLLHQEGPGRLPGNYCGSEGQPADKEDGEHRRPALHEKKYRTKKQGDGGQYLGPIAGSPPAQGDGQDQVAPECRGAQQPLLGGGKVQVFTDGW